MQRYAANASMCGCKRLWGDVNAIPLLHNANKISKMRKELLLQCVSCHYGNLKLAL